MNQSQDQKHVNEVLILHAFDWQNMTSSRLTTGDEKCCVHLHMCVCTLATGQSLAAEVPETHVIQKVMKTYRSAPCGTTVHNPTRHSLRRHNKLITRDVLL